MAAVLWPNTRRFPRQPKLARIVGQRDVDAVRCAGRLAGRLNHQLCRTAKGFNKEDHILSEARRYGYEVDGVVPTRFTVGVQQPLEYRESRACVIELI